MSDRVEGCFNGTSRLVRELLEATLNGDELSWQSMRPLVDAVGQDLHALVVVANEMRRRQVGEVVTYVVNRNINFTNVCVKTCKFCAFSRELRSEEGYFLGIDDVIARAAEAVAYGATEVCLQAGLAPNARGQYYIDLLRALKAELPDVHLHAYSPEEVKYGAALARLSHEEYLIALKEAGLDSMPGTSAEILDQALRDQISPDRITVDEWTHIVSTAHRVGLRTTATMMFGHAENKDHWLRHLAQLREIQQDTGGFTEFVPLSFVHSESPLFAASTVPGVQAGPSGNDVIRLYALSRLMLGPVIPNLQVSWVKEGPRMSQWILNCGANDLGGTLINESISTSAGATHGQLLSPASLRAMIRDAGRIPAQRRTDYSITREFDPTSAAEDGIGPLDRVDSPEAFGSYDELTQDDRFRYRSARSRLKAS